MAIEQSSPASFDTVNTREVTCPYCGDAGHDSWEIDFGPGLEGEAEIDCDSCGNKYIASREVSVTYSSRKK